MVRFLLELALLSGATVVVWRLVPGWWHWPAAILAVIAVAVIWGLFLSPRAAVPLPESAALGIEAALFLSIGIGLFATGLGTIAVVGVLLWVIDRVALALLGG
jgi:hypothetical protein